MKTDSGIHFLDDITSDTMASTLTVLSASNPTPMSPTFPKPKLRISTIYATGMRSPSDFNFLSEAFHPEFFLEHDAGEQSPAFGSFAMAELEDTSDSLPARRGGALRRSRTVTGFTSYKPPGSSKLARPSSAGSLKALSPTKFAPATRQPALPASPPPSQEFTTPVDKPTHVPACTMREETRQLEKRLRRLEAESNRLKKQNADLNNEVRQYKQSQHKPTLSVDTAMRTQRKPVGSTTTIKPRSGSGGSLRPSQRVVAPQTPTSMRTSADIPRPLNSNPVTPHNTPPKIKHPQPELTPPPSPESARTPILLEISTAKKQQIKAISAPVKGSVTRHHLAVEGLSQTVAPKVQTIPLRDAQMKAKIVVPSGLRAQGRRPSISAPLQADETAPPGAWCNVEGGAQKKKVGAKFGHLFSKLRRRS